MVRPRPVDVLKEALNVLIEKDRRSTDRHEEIIERFGGFKRVPFDEDWPQRKWKDDYWLPGMEKAKKMVNEVKKVFPLAEVAEK